MVFYECDFCLCPDYSDECLTPAHSFSGSFDFIHLKQQARLDLHPQQILEFSFRANHKEMVVYRWHRICFNPFSSVAQSYPTLCDPMNRSTPGLPVHHQLPEFTQTHIHRVSDAIQPSHPLSSPSPPAPNPSQHQSLFQ